MRALISDLQSVGLDPFCILCCVLTHNPQVGVQPTFQCVCPENSMG